MRQIKFEQNLKEVILEAYQLGRHDAHNGIYIKPSALFASFCESIGMAPLSDVSQNDNGEDINCS